jgi:hypothetical protein
MCSLQSHAAKRRTLRNVVIAILLFTGSRDQNHGKQRIQHIESRDRVIIVKRHVTWISQLARISDP